MLQVLVVTFLLSAPAPRPATPPGKLVWTFDDGPHSRTPKILDLLKCHGVKATFYVLGAMLRKQANRATLLRTVREGHLLGNHLYTHRNPCKISARVFKWELHRTRRLLDKLTRKTGVDGKRYRPPFGARCHRRLVWREGYRIMMWDVADIPRISARTYWRRALALLRRGRKVTLLFHYDVKRIAAVLRMAAAAGYVRRCVKP